MAKRKKRRTKLTGKRRRFADEYLVDCNATRAYKAAGFRAKTDAVAATLASRLLRDRQVAASIRQRQKKLGDKLEVTQERVLRELARLAFSDASRVMTWGPSGVVLVESKQLSEDDRRAVAEASQSVSETGGSIRLKLHDKKGALDSLAKHLGLFVDRVEHTVSFAAIVAGMRKPGEGPK